MAGGNESVATAGPPDGDAEPAPRNAWAAVDSSTIPAKLARELRDAWEGFVDGHALDSADDPGIPAIRFPIADSWQRSRDAGVDPHGRQAAPSVVELRDARALWAAHPLAVAVPLIEECMSVASADADHLVVLSDAAGMLLSVRGDVRVRSRAADEMNFVEGALWSEAGAGTNAVGTALAASHAVQVFAAEHFTEPVQRWTCAAAPIVDPDSGDLLGIIDLTGDFSGVHSHSLSLVMATARAVEGLLAAQMRERDDHLRARYATLLGPVSSGAALVTGTGRVLLDPHGSLAGVGAVSPTGWRVMLHAIPELTAERVADADVFVVRGSASAAAHPRTRPRVAPKPAPRPTLTLRVLGDDPEVLLDGEPVHLRPRHIELLTLLMLHRGRARSEALSAELYGEDGHPASIRVELSRLRKVLPGAIEPTGFALAAEVDADLKTTRALLGRGAVTEAASTYPGPLLPASTAPGIERARDELEAWLRQAVVTSDDADTLWAWVRSSSGERDLMAWRRLLAALAYTDARRSLAATRTLALQRESSRQQSEV